MALTVLFQVTSPISFKTPGETISSNSMRKGKESWGSQIKPSSAHLWDSEMEILKKYINGKKFGVFGIYWSSNFRTSNSGVALTRLRKVEGIRIDMLIIYLQCCL